MGKPGAAKGGRKAKTAELRPRYADADADLNDADDFIEALRDIDDTHRLFVETYFNLRHIGAGGTDGGAA